MAKTVVVVLRCDRCKAERNEDVDGVESVSFGFEGYVYSIDLCSEHGADFHNTVQGLISLASDRSRVGGSRRIKQSRAEEGTTTDPVAPRRSASGRDHLRAIREWARQNGHPGLSDRGRIPQRIIDDYESAVG